jgi:hypothetical protein
MIPLERWNVERKVTSAVKGTTGKGASPRLPSPIGWMVPVDVSGVPDSLERKLQLDTTSLLEQATTGGTTFMPWLPWKPGTAVRLAAWHMPRYIGDLFAAAEELLFQHICRTPAAAVTRSTRSTQHATQATRNDTPQHVLPTEREV